MGMKGKIQSIDFIEYISKPMNKEDIILMYKINSVIPERSGLYLDFTHSLFDIVTTTYLGDEIMDGKHVKEHFDWCWNKILLAFKKEKIYFDGTDLYSYFFTLFLESFYSEIDKSDDNVNKLLEFWQDIFTYSTTKTRSELEAFIDLYKLFDKSLNN
jgi:hypothetical protein